MICPTMKQMRNKAVLNYEHMETVFLSESYFCLYYFFVALEINDRGKIN